MIAGVLVEISNRNVDRIFEYSIPEQLLSSIKVGVRVLVPFGSMTLEGFVLEIKKSKSTDKDLREIIDIVDKDSLFIFILLSKKFCFKFKGKFMDINELISLPYLP